MPSPHETCDECGFDAADWNDLDTARTIDAAGALVGLWTERMPDDLLGQRPEAETWSVLEYIDHLRETFFGMRLMVRMATEAPDTDLGPMIEPAPAGEAKALNPTPTINRFTEEAGALATTVHALTGPDREQAVIFGGEPHTISWATRHAVHDLFHHLVDIARIRVTLGDATATSTGTVEQLNVSGGGVPKLPIDEAVVGRRGLEGDTQSARVHHGRPWQALCLWSSDVIDALRAEGHPISAGSAGENITLRGIDWPSLRAGSILEIGEVRCQISAAAVPCKKNAQWFRDGDFNRILHDDVPGVTRWYASVLETGTIRPGDTATVVA